MTLEIKKLQNILISILNKKPSYEEGYKIEKQLSCILQGIDERDLKYKKKVNDLLDKLHYYTPDKKIYNEESKYGVIDYEELCSHINLSFKDLTNSL